MARELSLLAEALACQHTLLLICWQASSAQLEEAHPSEHRLRVGHTHCLIAPHETCWKRWS
jgi:hypothetical protein